MKNNLGYLATLAFILFSLGSCKTTKDSAALRREDMLQSKKSQAACFVEMNDGSIKTFSTLTLVTGMFTSPYLLGNGNIKLNAKNIKAYQDKDHYAISQSNFLSGHHTYIAGEALPGFAIRIAKGKVNVYVKKYYNGNTAVDEYFLQQGDDGQVLAYTTESMNQVIKNDPEALDFFISKKYTTPKVKKSQAVVLYAQEGGMMTRNK